MIQAVHKESKEQKEWLDQCLVQIKDLVYFFEHYTLSYDSIYRCGTIFAVEIKNCYPVYELIDNDLVPTQNAGEFVKILTEKFRYLTAYVHTESFSLYPLGQALRQHYLSQGYFAMRIGQFDWTAYYKYKAKMENNQ